MMMPTRPTAAFGMIQPQFLLELLIVLFDLLSTIGDPGVYAVGWLGAKIEIPGHTARRTSVGICFSHALLQVPQTDRLAGAALGLLEERPPICAVNSTHENHSAMIANLADITRLLQNASDQTRDCRGFAVKDLRLTPASGERI
jgi:hypothetical protein